jgi:hypothetical protein
MPKTKSKQKKMNCKDSSMILGKAFLLTLFAVFLAHYLSDVWGIENLAVTGGTWGWIALFVWYLVFMVIGLKILDFLNHGKKINF